LIHFLPAADGLKDDEDDDGLKLLTGAGLKLLADDGLNEGVLGTGAALKVGVTVAGDGLNDGTTGVVGAAAGTGLKVDAGGVVGTKAAAVFPGVTVAGIFGVVTVAVFAAALG
jgi:hypothetical protein